MANAVLVLDGTPRSVVTICRSLQRHGIRAVCAGIGTAGLGLKSRAVVADVALAANAQSFLDELKALVRLHEIDTILPCSDDALNLLLRHYEEAKGIAYLPFRPDAVARVLDKHETLKLASLLGVPTPATVAVNDAALGLQGVKEALRFPLVAKPAGMGERPFKVKYLDRPEELEAFAKSPLCRGSLVFQEFFAGEGVGISTIAVGAKPLVLFAHRRLHEYPPAGGVGVLLESQIVDGKLGHAANALLEALNWEGPAMVEFRRDAATGQYVLMEINGRFWGSLPLATLAGLDFPYWQWQIAHGITPVVPARYRHGLRVRWTAGEIQRFADLMTDADARQRVNCGTFSAALQLAKSFDPRVKSALFSIRDPQPELRSVATTVARIFGSLGWRLAQRILPAEAVLWLTQLRLLDRQYRGKYIARSLLRSMKARGGSAMSSSDGIRSVTFVCRANRIRSPLAAGIFAAKVPDDALNGFAIASAGTQANVETDFDPRAQASAKAMGLCLEGRPRPVTAELVQRSDLIIVMDRIVEAELLTQFPGAASKVAFLGDSAKSGWLEVLDPDRKTAAEFRQCIGELAAGVEYLATSLAASSAAGRRAKEYPQTAR